MALGRILSKQMSDIFGDYILKSAKSVEESPTGRTKPKPAAKYIKEMEKEGISKEEMQDLGLYDDFDPKKGPRRQEQMTRGEMLDEIIKRRQEKLRGVASSREQDPFGESTAQRYSGPEQRDPEYAGYVADIGRPGKTAGKDESYQEVVFSKPPEGRNVDVSYETKQEALDAGVHFREKNQIFHLRTNQGETPEGEKTTNILELQSDIQQRAQKGERNVDDPDLPMVKNWERLGVKEAINIAKERGDRYVAVAPGEEVAESVLSRTRAPMDTEIKINKSPDSDKYQVESMGIDLKNSFAQFNEEDMFSPQANFDLMDAIEASEADMNDLMFFYKVNKFDDFGMNTSDLKNTEAYKNVLELEKNFSKINEEEGLDYTDFDEMIEVEFVDEDTVFDMLDLRESLTDEPIALQISPDRSFSAKELSEELRVPESKVRSVANTESTLTLPAGGGIGGRGIIDFYDKRLLAEKVLKDYDIPVVEIEQFRPDGSTVKTKALDLKNIKDKKIPMSLYQFIPTALGAGTIGTAAMTQNVDAQTDNALGMAEGGMLDEGGLKDQGGEVDPVSGNEVPAGSLKEEVRDDIDVRLSEGEFVFPADVVRYIGLDRLMELRQKAKQGLEKMDDMGQMANAEEAVIPDDVSHESIEMNQGGFLGQQDPSYQEAGAVYTAPKFSGQQQQSTQSVYGAEQFQTAPSQFATPPAVGIPTPPGAGGPPPAPVRPTYEMKKFVNAQGGVMYIPFINGEPQFAIPEGFTEEARDPTAGLPEEPDTTVPDTGVETAQVTDSGGGDDRDEGPSVSTAANPTMGLSKALSALNPDSQLASDYNSLKKDQLKGTLGVALSVLSGNPIGAGIGAYRLNERTKEGEAALNKGLKETLSPAAVATLTPTVRGDLKNVGQGQFLGGSYDRISTDEMASAYEQAKRAGASDALAAAIATSATSQSFIGPSVTEIGKDGTETTRGGFNNLGEFERQTAEALGIEVDDGTRTDTLGQQAAMLTEQDFGLFDTPEERAAFYGKDYPGAESDSFFGDDDDPRDYADTAEDYGTTVGSEQTSMLAEQDAGLFDDDDDDDGGRDFGSDFGSRDEQDAVEDSGWGSDDHFDAIDDQFDSLDDDDDDGGGGDDDGGRYCCSRMVHHDLWTVEREFARLSAWSRKQPNWWRSGYPVWGKIVAKYLLGKEGFWTSVMQAFYDNHVMKKPRSLKSTLADVIIFPGSFVCGMIWKRIPEKATLADPREFN